MKSKLALELIKKQLKRKKVTKAGKERKENYPENYSRRKESVLIHEHLFLGVAGNEKVCTNLSTGRTCNL